MGIEEFNEDWYNKELEENKLRDTSSNYNIFCGLIIGVLISSLKFMSQYGDISIEGYNKLKEEIISKNKRL